LLKKSYNNLPVLCVIWNSVFLCKKRHVQTKNEPLDLLNICILPGPIFSLFTIFIFAIGFFHLSEWTGAVLLDNKQCKEFFEKDFRLLKKVHFTRFSAPEIIKFSRSFNSALCPSTFVCYWSNLCIQ
jgi:hypothetical protein